MPHLKLERLRAARLEIAAFAYVIVPGFLQPESWRSVNAIFPAIDKGGSFPLDTAASAADELDDGRREPWAAFTLA